MTRTIDMNVVRDEIWVQTDLLTRSIAGAIIAEALQMAARCQVNRVHRLQRGEDAGPTVAEELSGKTVFDIMKWAHVWMLAPRPLEVTRAGIHKDHQYTVMDAAMRASRNELLKDLPRLQVKTEGGKNFTLLVYFA